MPFEDIKGPLSNWVTTDSIQRQIKQRFRAFLDQYRDENNNPVYKQRIRDMCIGESLPLLWFYSARCLETPMPFLVLHACCLPAHSQLKPCLGPS